MSGHLGYTGAHERVYRAKGPASAHRCTDCGAGATEWSYDGRDADELTCTRRTSVVAYSLDPSHYEPRCKRCHIAFDMGVSVGQCKRGHLLAETASSSGQCRECHRVWKREYRQRRRQERARLQERAA